MSGVNMSDERLQRLEEKLDNQGQSIAGLKKEISLVGRTLEKVADSQAQMLNLNTRIDHTEKQIKEIKKNDLGDLKDKIRFRDRIAVGLMFIVATAVVTMFFGLFGGNGNG